jgi:hypothetical protein
MGNTCLEEEGKQTGGASTSVATLLPYPPYLPPPLLR